MRHASRLLLVLGSCGLLLGATASAASATTIEDLIKLKANKTTPVSDDVLIALIESDGSVFHLTADDIPGLRQKGLSERVIIAMLLTAKNARPAELIEIPPMDPSALPPAPESAAQSYTTQVAAPPDSMSSAVQAGVPALADETRYDPRPAYTPTYVPVYVPVAVPVVRRPPPPAPEPVYWGYGGKLRPDAWQPAPTPPKTTPDRTTPVTPQPKRGGGER